MTFMLNNHQKHILSSICFLFLGWGRKLKEESTLNRKTRGRGLYLRNKTFSVLIYSYINTSGNWKNEKLDNLEKLEKREITI